jgi:hypothetical protein
VVVVVVVGSGKFSGGDGGDGGDEGDGGDGGVVLKWN